MKKIFIRRERPIIASKRFISWPLLLRIVSIVDITMLIVLLALSWFTEFDNASIWIPTQYMVPFLFMGTWIPFALSFLGTDIEVSSIKRSVSIILFGGMLVVMGALLLNTRLLFTIFYTLGDLFLVDWQNEIDQFVVLELIVGIILPLNEEFMKIIPILVVSHAPLVLFNPQNDDFSTSYIKQESISTRRQFALYGLISGSVFTFLELFLYQWQNVAEIPELIFIQLFFRTIFPIHILATVFVCLGIYNIKKRLIERSTKTEAFFSSLFFLVIGYGFHSIWNSINIFYSVFSLEAQDELFFVQGVFGAIADIILLITIILVFRPTPQICSRCGFESRGHTHNESRSTNLEKKLSPSRIDSFLSKIPLFSKISQKTLRKRLSCPFCLTPSTSGTCSVCGARTFVSCPFCDSFISETTSVCPNPECKRDIHPLINIHFDTFSLPETIILGITSLASMAFLLAPISTLFLSPLGDMTTLYTPILLFYFLMSLTALTNTLIALYFNRTVGMLVLFCYFIELAMLLFIISSGVIITGIVKSIIFLDVIGFVVLLIAVLGLFWLVTRFFNTFYFNYSPIFTENSLLSKKRKMDKLVIEEEER